MGNAYLALKTQEVAIHVRKVHDKKTAERVGA
jgi:hypothetical protein